MRDSGPALSVLVIFSSSSLGGAERSLTRMGLLDCGCSYRFATLGGEGPWCDWVRGHGLKPVVLGAGLTGAIGFLIAMFRLFRYLTANSVDIVYVCGIKASFLLRLSRIFIRRFALVHGVRWNPVSDNVLDRATRLIERYCHWLVDGWVTNSAAARDTLVHRCHVRSERVEVIYNGIDAVPTSPSLLADRPCEVLIVANVSPRKGHIPFLDVVNQVVVQIPEVRFVFVGRDDMQGALQNAILSRGLSRNVSYEGFQENPSYFYRRAKIFVLPSLWGEGCPTAILEAFSHAVPVVAYDIDGVPELLLDGINGYVISPRDTATMAVRIVALLQDSRLSQALGDAGRKLVMDSFTLERCALRHSHYFRSIRVGRE